MVLDDGRSILDDDGERLDLILLLVVVLEVGAKMSDNTIGESLQKYDRQSGGSLAV